MPILKNFEDITGFVCSMEYLEKYGIQLSVFQGHEYYDIRSCFWKSMDFRSLVEFFPGGAKLLYASIFFMQFAVKLS